MIFAPLRPSSYDFDRFSTPLVRAVLPLRAFWLLTFCLLAFVAAAPVAAAPSAAAADIIVTTAEDENNSDGDCSLREAVEAANTNAAVDGCAAGTSDDDVITFSSALTITLTMGELTVSDDVAIDAAGVGRVTIDAGGNSRIFSVDVTGGDEFPGSAKAVFFQSLVLTGGDAGSGSGGAVTIGPGGEATFSDVDVTESVAGGSGGGLYAAGATDVTIRGGSVSGNTAGKEGGGLWTSGTLTAGGGLSVTGNAAMGDANNDGGGGLFVRGGSATLDTVFVDDNAASGTHGRGGGLNVAGNDASLAMTGGSVSGNSAPGAGGGGITVQGSSATLKAVTVEGNSTTEGGVGGGLFVENGSATVSRSTFSNNSAGYGGGLWARGTAAIDVDQSTVSQNEATTGDGGGIYSTGDGASVTLTSSTVADNSASREGGGLARNSGAFSFGNALLTGNTAGDAGNDCAGTFTSSGFNLVGDPSGCTLEGDTEGNVTGQDPRLGPLADNGGPTRTHLPQTSSPVIDAGRGVGEADLDQRGLGFPRTQDLPDADNAGDGTDIGSIEVQAASDSTQPRRWAGSETTEGAIYRNGPVGLEGANARLGIGLLPSEMGYPGLHVRTRLAKIVLNDQRRSEDAQGFATTIDWRMNDKPMASMGTVGNSQEERLGRFWISVDGSSESPWEDGHFVIAANENVGIGTASPPEKLSVAGTVQAQEVVVIETGWSDFVFEEGYDLPALEEIQAHIHKQGHLPGIPSAEEVAREGVRLGQMEARLLQKIEELTLYAIEQEKRADALEARLIEQQKQLDAQQKRIEQLLRCVEVSEFE